MRKMQGGMSGRCDPFRDKGQEEEQGREGFVSGPRKLGVPGARSNLYAMFLRFGIITADPK